MTLRGPVLLTGASGRLGRELLTELPRHGVEELLTPTSGQLDITAAHAVMSYVARHRPRLIVHAAAYTDVTRAETERAACWSVNVEGTRHLVAQAREVGARFLLVSTDYVFSGDRSGDADGRPDSRGPGYLEDDPPGPVRNYYALTKLVAEEAARSYPGSLVLRTSFRPREWQYPAAFDDLFTSQDYVDVIAPSVAQVIHRFDRGEIPFDTLHVATERKSVYELALRRAPGVKRASRTSAPVELPADVTLNTDRWRELKRGWEPNEGGT